MGVAAEGGESILTQVEGHRVCFSNCRLAVAFNTSSGIPVTHVTLSHQGSPGRKAGAGSGGTNLAEAGTTSLEFTTAGRLLGEFGLSC
jgi:hypothetical protein